jgi:NCS1 family nucleobase:cation symporter-1
LYDPNGEYSFTKGFSYVALIALVAGALPSIPGFLAQVKVVNPATIGTFWVRLYDYAWFVGFGVAFGVYLLGRALTSPAGSSAMLEQPKAAVD